MVMLDIIHIENWSLTLDLQIRKRAPIPAVLRTAGTFGWVGANIVWMIIGRYGGAEREVLEVFHQLSPLLLRLHFAVRSDKMPAHFGGWDPHLVHASLNSAGPLALSPPCCSYPLAFELFGLSGYDVVISNSSAWCKG